MSDAHTAENDVSLWRTVSGVVLRECPICYAVVDYFGREKHARWHEATSVTSPEQTEATP